MTMTYDDSEWANLKRELLTAITAAADGKYAAKHHPFTIVDKYIPLIEEEILLEKEATND